MARTKVKKIHQRETHCFEVRDSSQVKIPAPVFIPKGSSLKDPNPQAARLARQFINQNYGLLTDYNIDTSLTYDGQDVEIKFVAGTKIGALPLLSPTSGQADYGLVIKPRYHWSGLGPMLSAMGWKILPRPLKLPPIPGTERKVPPWVLSSIILFRIKNLLDRMERRFELVENDLRAPKGNINWTRYLTEKMPQAKFLNVPCQYPDLRDDRELKAAIHFTLKKHLNSLQTQRHTGIAAIQLIELCQRLLTKVKNVPSKIPQQKTIESWLRGTFKTAVFKEGLQAIEWTVDDRGLAGISDLQGLPWIMSMEQFFEAWVETIAEKLVRLIGGKLRTGREHETVYPLTWDPPYMGSQKSLIPDFIIEKEEMTIILDAKYKSHWEDLSSSNWYELADKIKERHREDLMQILAYSNLSDKSNVISCLIYPSRKNTWLSLKERDRISHRASVNVGKKKLTLLLTAIPMDAQIYDIAKILSKEIFKNNQ
ncbi:MAG: hypothetical protein PHV06_00975 [bacterium]|nr:hypothetical protein [bacterium]